MNCTQNLGIRLEVQFIFFIIVMLNFLEYLDNYSFFKVTGGIKDTLWTRWALILSYFLNFYFPNKQKRELFQELPS